jgi:orotidine-5'-phosphate decarboxylase
MVDVPGYDKNQAILIKISAEAQFMKINYRSILANEQYVMKTCSSASRQIWRQALRLSPLALYAPANFLVKL